MLKYGDVMRDYNALAAAIGSGVIRVDHGTPCTAAECDNPLLVPIAFNPLGRVSGGYVCEACNAWEHAHGTTQHNPQVTS